jgi:hypothetical protein
MLNKKYFLLLAILIFGIFSEPTPDGMSIAEAVIVICLALSINYTGTFKKIFFLNSGFDLSQFTIFVVIILPLLGFILFLNNDSQAIRDFIAACFMCLPFFMFKMDKREINLLSFVVFVSGCLFAGREFSHFQVSDLLLIGTRAMVADQSYLLQDPIVLFAALYSVKKILSSLETRSVLLTGFFIGTFILVFSSFFLQALRLNIIITVMYLIYSVHNVSLYLVRIVYFILLITGTVASLQYSDFFGLFFKKFTQVGDNGKVKEFSAVLNYMANPTFIFGKGFGGEFLSPTYDVFVSYTHSLLSYLILKSGLLGLLYGIFLYVSILYAGVKSITSKDATLQIAVLSIIPALVTQPTYKSFGFGVVTVLFYMCWLTRKDKI